MNLSRFSLFFSEKREFFLERAGLFEHGNSRSTQTFFSRRIGLTDQILTGARVTGQSGRFSYGAMNIETGSKMKDLFGDQSANNTVARVQANVMPRATVGAIATNVEEIGGGFNRAFGMDANYRFWSSSQFNAWFTNVWDDTKALNDNAGHVNLRLDNDTYSGGFSYTHVGRNYNPALGFVRRQDIRQYSGSVGYNPRVEVSALPNLARLNFSSGYDYIEGQDGVKQSSQLSGTAGLEFNSTQSISFNAQQQFERLFVPFNIRQDAVIEAGDYTFNRFSLNASSNDSRQLFGSAGITFGSFYNGDRTDFGFDLGFRYNKHLSFNGGVDHSMISLPVANGDFEATTLSGSIFGAISRKLYAKALVQYDNFSRDIQTYLRINWIHTPGSDLFIVFNTSHHITGGNEQLFDPRKDLIMNNQAAIVKLTYLIML